jgi:dTDP-4-amino-4,6-dideoxygalactose transaminase
MLRFVAPAGAAPRIPEILRGLKVILPFKENTDQGILRFAARFPARHVVGFSSGRAALSVILKGLHRMRPDRCIVALPAYTCFTVAASVARAGLKIYPIDIDPETLDFDFSGLQSLPQKGLLCILVCNLFGLMNDVAGIQEIARAKGALVVDDAAQAMGAYRDGRPAGLLGDVGSYSLGRGKALASLEGGIIVTDSDPIASAIEAEARDLPPATAAYSAWLGIKMMVYAILIDPRLYWIPNAFPFLKLGMTEFEPDFHIGRLSLLHGILLPALLEQLSEINQIRRRNANTLTSAIEGNPFFTTPRRKGDCEPTYVRFPVIARDRATRDRTVARLRAAGIGASAFYPSAVCDIPGIEKHMALADFHRPQAESIAQRLLTLPTHPSVRHVDLERMAHILNGT